MKFIELRKNLLQEAQSSPNLLSDLAGLESYIAESYNNRSFIELIQNADDAGATKFKIIEKDDFLYVANNGRIFNENDLESLCRSASSNKVRGETIGYRGIGFKSVVGYAKEIHILSGEFEITFSKEHTKNEIPNATRVPLIRIPHEINTNIKEQTKSIVSKLFNEQFTTIFIFSGITAQQVRLEFDTFDTTSLMFLKNICESEFSTSEIKKTKILKERVSDIQLKMTIKSEEFYSEWMLYSLNNCTIAYSVKNDRIQKLPENKSIVYAFLPTENLNGLGVLINGDFSTDPSRKHIIYDNRTVGTINFFSELILRIIEEHLSDYNLENYDIVNALIPYADPRMLQFKKTSFDKFLIEGMKEIKSAKLKNLKICPTWFNINDYSNLKQDKNIFTINGNFLSIDGFISFAKYNGAKEDNIHDILKIIDTSLLSIVGCAQLIVQIFKSLISGVLKVDSSILNHKLFISDNKKYSLRYLKDNEIKIDEDFILLIIEYGLTEFEIKAVFKQLISKEFSDNLFPPKGHDIINSITNNTTSINDYFSNKTNELIVPSSSRIPRWRSAEEITLEVLNQNGFKLEDVSKQNIGYDLSGIDPNGIPIQIEVKSINYLGQQFRITNNEIAIAQDKQETYIIAIVRILNDSVEIALISNPVKNLKLNRQCVQWIWECSEYEYKPIIFHL